MYGKVFEQMFTGSLVGAGPDVFAVWTYAIVHARSPGEVELNPRLLSVMLGMTVEEVEQVIEKLCSPDPYSRTPDLEGTRMVRRGQFLYFLPNWQKYRDIRNDEERRERERTYKRSYRASLKSKCPDLSDSQPDNSGQSENVRVLYASESASIASVVEEREHEREEAPKPSRTKSVPKPDKVDQQHWNDWLAARRAKRAGPVTETVLKMLIKEANLAGITLDKAVYYAAASNWITFKAAYMVGKQWDEVRKNDPDRWESSGEKYEDIDGDTPLF